MAVHSFASIGEIRDAKTDGEREIVRAKVLAESRTFDTHVRDAVRKDNAEERKKALLELESLPEFKRSHPTVEVSIAETSLPHKQSQSYPYILITDGQCVALHSTPGGGWRSWGCEGRAPRRRCSGAWHVISELALQLVI